MIPTDIYSTKEEALITSGVDAWLARIQAVLEHGKESGNITSEEANAAISTFTSFLSSNPDYTFLSPKERHKTGEKESEEEAQMWSKVQPMLDKAQGVE